MRISLKKAFYAFIILCIIIFSCLSFKKSQNIKTLQKTRIDLKKNDTVFTFKDSLIQNNKMIYTTLNVACDSSFIDSNFKKLDVLTSMIPNFIDVNQEVIFFIDGKKHQKINNKDVIKQIGLNKKQFVSKFSEKVKGYFETCYVLKGTNEIYYLMEMNTLNSMNGLIWVIYNEKGDMLWYLFSYGKKSLEYQDLNEVLKQNGIKENFIYDPNNLTKCESKYFFE